MNLVFIGLLRNKNRDEVCAIITQSGSVFLASSHPMNDHSRPFIALTIARVSRSFGVAHTSFAPGFVPDSGLMTTDHFITAESATGTAIKLYRFHYNLTDDFPSI